MELRLTLEGGRGRCNSGGFLLRIMPPSWQPVPACASNGHSAGGPFNTATTGFRRRNYSSLRQRKLESDAHRCDKYCCRRNYSSLRQRKLESDASPLRQKLLQAGHSSLRQRKFESDTASMRLRLLQAGHSTCRHDGTAVILDFRPRIDNHCNR